MVEAMLASGLMAMGLAAAVRLNMVGLAASQNIRNIDMASALAQDLGECWGVQTPICLQQFANTSEFSPFSHESQPTWTRTWQVSDITVQGAPSGSLKELRIKVSWPEGEKRAELVWVQRRASTPNWVGS